MGVLSRCVLGCRSAAAIAWLFVALVFLIPVAGLARVLDRRQRVYDGCAIVWARGILLLMGMRVSCRGAEHVRCGEHYVVAANHQGALDIPALIVALQPHTSLRFVAKRSLFRVPLLGWGMRLFGHVAIDRRGAQQALPALLQAQEDVRRRWSVVFFPEGTRTYTGGMGPFKKGAFHTAARARARVLPVTIIGSWEKLPRERLFALSQGVIQIRVHESLPAPGESPEQVQVAADDCRRQIEAALPAAGADALASAE